MKKTDYKILCSFFLGNADNSEIYNQLLLEKEIEKEKEKEDEKISFTLFVMKIYKILLIGKEEGKENN